MLCQEYAVKWAMRDSNGGAQKPLYIEAALEQGTSRVAQGVARMQLSQVVALLIERWDELDHVVKTEFAVLLSSNEHLIPSKQHQTGAEQSDGTNAIVDTVTTLIGDVTSKTFPDDQVIQRFNQT